MSICRCVGRQAFHVFSQNDAEIGPIICEHLHKVVEEAKSVPSIDRLHPFGKDLLASVANDVDEDNKTNSGDSPSLVASTANGAAGNQLNGAGFSVNF